MKKILLSAVVIMLAFVANAQPPAGDAKPGEWYGEKITAGWRRAILPMLQKTGKIRSLSIQRSKQRLWRFVLKKDAG